MPEIMLTIVSAYMTYLVGDRLLGVSGVLAVVALGLWMSAFGVNYVSRKVEAALEVVWDVLEYCANTLIFVLRWDGRRRGGGNKRGRKGESERR